MSLDIDAIRNRADRVRTIAHGPNALLRALASADDVPALLAEIERLTEVIRINHDGADYAEEMLDKQAKRLAAYENALRAAGIEHPISPQGIEDLAAMASGRLEELRAVEQDRDHARSDARKALDLMNGELDKTRAEVKRLSAHSITLNTIAWKIATALGDATPAVDAIVGNPEEQATRLIDAFDRERLRTEMMAYQRGAVLEVVHRMQLGNWTKQDIAAHVDEIFKAGMAAEVKRGYDEQLAAVEQDRDRLSDELDRARVELERLGGADDRVAALEEENDRLHDLVDNLRWADSEELAMALAELDRARPVLDAAKAWADAVKSGVITEATFNPELALLAAVEERQAKLLLPGEPGEACGAALDSHGWVCDRPHGHDGPHIRISPSSGTDAWQAATTPGENAPSAAEARRQCPEALVTTPDEMMVVRCVRAGGHEGNHWNRDREVEWEPVSTSEEDGRDGVDRFRLALRRLDLAVRFGCSCRGRRVVVVSQMLRNLARRWAAARLTAEADGLRRRLTAAEAAVGRLTQERDQARQEALDVKDCNEWQVDQIESLEKALDAAREETRQAVAARGVVEQDAAASRAELARLRGAVQP